jgi:hypothetical protein
MIMHRGLKLLAMVIPILGVAGWVFARADNMPESPNPEGSSVMGAAIGYALAFLVAIGLLGFKSSRRTNID